MNLLLYGFPCGRQVLLSVLLLATVGLLDNFHTLQFHPIFDKALVPDVLDQAKLRGTPVVVTIASPRMDERSNSSVEVAEKST